MSTDFDYNFYYCEEDYVSRLVRLDLIHNPTCYVDWIIGETINHVKQLKGDFSKPTVRFLSDVETLVTKKHCEKTLVTTLYVDDDPVYSISHNWIKDDSSVTIDSINQKLESSRGELIKLVG